MEKDHFNKSNSGLISKILTGIMIGLLVIVVFLFYGDLSEVSEVILSFSSSVITVMILLTLLSYLFRFIKWHYFLKQLNIDVSLKDSFNIFFIGLSMSITPGKIGELIKAYLLKKVSNVKMTYSAPAVFVDRLTDMIAMAILISFGLTIFTVGYLSIFILMAALLIMVTVLRTKHLSVLLIRMITSLRWTAKYRENITVMYESIYSLLNLKPLLISSAVSVVAWFMECLSLYILIRAVPLDLTIFHSTFIFSFGTVAGALSMLPGGLGVAEGSIMGMFMYFGIERSMAVSLALIIRLVTLWLGVFIGLIIFFKTRKKYMINNQ